MNVQTSTQSSVSVPTPVEITVSATTQWNLVIVHIKTNDANATVSSVIDNMGNTYVVSSPLSFSTARMWQAYGIQATGGATTITVNTTGTGGSMRAGADEYSGFSVGATNTAVFDVTSTGSGSGTSMSVSSFSPSAVGEFIVASGATSANETWTSTANYTLYNGVNPITVRSAYRLSGSLTETAPITITNGDWGEIATAFKDGSSASQSTLHVKVKGRVRVRGMVKFR